MSENSDDRQLTTISKADTTEDIANFWDSHSLADYWDQTESAEFEVSSNLSRRYLVGVDSELFSRVRSMAHFRGINTEGLVNLLLEQRLNEIG